MSLFVCVRLCDAVFCAPGNEGITQSGTATPVIDSSAVISFCREWGVGLVVVVCQEAALLAGLVDVLLRVGIQAFGPSAEAAALEGSKDFMKSLCYKYIIPTAKYKRIHKFRALHWQMVRLLHLLNLSGL